MLYISNSSLSLVSHVVISNFECVSYWFVEYTVLQDSWGTRTQVSHLLTSTLPRSAQTRSVRRAPGRINGGQTIPLPTQLLKSHKTTRRAAREAQNAKGAKPASPCHAVSGTHARLVTMGNFRGRWHSKLPSSPRNSRCLSTLSKRSCCSGQSAWLIVLAQWSHVDMSPATVANHCAPTHSCRSIRCMHSCHQMSTVS